MIDPSNLLKSEGGQSRNLRIAIVSNPHSEMVRKISVREMAKEISPKFDGP
jgi:hypothetical protein